MLFLDDFLEMLDELPMELRDRCTEMRQLDLEVQTGQERINKAILEYFDNSAQLTDDQKKENYEMLQKEYARLRALGEEKVAMAERMQELVEKYVQHLEKEKTHFKYELEADNPGVTETIENRFSSYVQSVISLRKDRKRKHGNGHSNGHAAVFNGEPVNKVGRTSIDDFSLSNAVQHELGLMDDDIFSLLPMVSSPVNGNKKKDEVPKKRSSISNTLKTSLSVPSAMNAAIPSPSASEKGWNSPVPGDHSPNSSFLGSSFGHGQVPSMSAFVGPESRHGRPRKLTVRVQEMFTEAVQRQRRPHPTFHQPETEGEPTGSDGDDSDDAQKTWCFCGESSYGDMVACDNKECAHQWFHYGCVGIAATPKGKWFCPQCTYKQAQSATQPQVQMSEANTSIPMF